MFEILIWPCTPFLKTNKILLKSQKFIESVFVVEINSRGLTYFIEDLRMDESTGCSRLLKSTHFCMGYIASFPLFIYNENRFLNIPKLFQNGLILQHLHDSDAIVV